MPKRLLDRCTQDCIQQFRRAAFERLLDGDRLEAAGRGTAAIYVWGYTAEMLLKAAYFRAVGYSVTQHITLADLRAARNSAAGLGFSWGAGNLHHLESWANLLVHYRGRVMPYSSRRFPSQLVMHGLRVGGLWRETLRYHWNKAYDFETQRARHAVEWFVAHWDEM